MTNKNALFLLCLSLIIGGILRICVIIDSGPGPQFDFPCSSDEVNYRDISDNLAERKTFGAWMECFFASSVRAPVYPAVLASAKFAFPSPWTPVAMNVLLDILNLFMIFLLACEISGRAAGAITSFLYSIFSPSLLYIKFSTPEIFSIFLLLGFLISLLKYQKILSLPFWGVIIFYVLLIHSRPAFLPVLLGLPVVIWLKINRDERVSLSRSLRKKIINSIFPAALILILCIPWGYRNYSIHKTIAPVSLIPAWHFFESSDTDLSLSTKKAIEFIYDPAHKGYSEGDYYKKTMAEFSSLLHQHPLEIFLSGIARIAKGWCFPDFYKRIFLPYAYFNPIRVCGNILLPMPDFEGFVYIFAITLLVAFLLKRKQFFDTGKNEMKDKLFLLVFVGIYTAAHIVAVPFPQYRFIIEPLILILMVSVLISIFNFEEKSEKNGFPKISGKIVPFLSFTILFFTALPLLIPGTKRVFDYPSEEKSNTAFSYDEIRTIQWNNRGKIQAPTRCRASGRIKHPVKGFLFSWKDGVPAEKDKNWIAAKLYINEDSPDFPFGKGDIKVNIPDTNNLKNGDYIFCEGFATDGIYGDIVLQVDNWRKLNEKK